MSEARESSVINRQSLLAVLSGHIGAAAGISVGKVVAELLRTVGRIPADAERAALERQVRDLVVKLRLDGHHICAHPSLGYYMAATPEELDACCKFLFERAVTSLAQVAAMKRVSLPDLRGQLHLPT